MKLKVKKEFRDKYTGKTRKVGDIFEATNARKIEIQRKGDYVEVVTPEKVEVVETEKVEVVETATTEKEKK